MEQYLTVSELTKYISRKFQYDPYLERIYLKGEISNYNSKRKGITQYFNLKDEKSIIPAILFPRNAQNLKFDLEEGMGVMITGRVQVYEPQGKYQIVIDSMQPDGIGALYLAFEQIKEKLTKEGLFASELKKEIPQYPKRIGVITSQSGAVIQDILTTVKRRYPITEIVLFPTYVQGERSADSIVDNLRKAEEKKDLDIIIIARGGGSFEDLFSFNEEKVVRAIAKAKTPIISSIGHETDTTLTDLVADLRAPTPTAAAELAVPVLADEILKLEEYEQRLIRVFQTKLQYLSSQLSKITSSVIFRQPQRLYDGYLQNIDQLENKLINIIDNQLKESKQRYVLLHQQLHNYPIQQKITDFNQSINYTAEKMERIMQEIIKENDYKLRQLIQALEHLSPLTILARGYATIERENKLIHSATELSEGETLQIRMHDGKIDANIEKIYEKEE